MEKYEENFNNNICNNDFAYNIRHYSVLGWRN